MFSPNKLLDEYFAKHPSSDRNSYDEEVFHSFIIDYATKDDGQVYIVATEEGILYELNKRNPNKKFIIPGDGVCCQDMKKTTLENLYNCLLNMEYEIVLDEEIRKKALRSLENMHKLGSDK